MPPHNVDARFGLKPHRLGNRVGEAFFERWLVVGLFVADFFQIRNHGRRPHQAADMAYDDATIRPQHISPPRYGTHPVSSEARDGIMERLIAQDRMIIAASSRGVMHTANTARRSPAKSCTSQE
jgi:hypothetical protein